MKYAFGHPETLALSVCRNAAVTQCLTLFICVLANLLYEGTDALDFKWAVEKVEKKGGKSGLTFSTRLYAV